MLYPQNQEPQLSDALFKHPTSEYRGTPFWAWNGKLSRDELLRQIKIFKNCLPYYMTVLIWTLNYFYL